MSVAEEVLVSFRAGLMKPENNTLKADQRKGSIQLVQSTDGLTHFRWHERVGVEPNHPAQHDFIVFPSEAEYKKVAGAGAGARIYTLEFAADKDRTLFFWMQEPKPDNDETLTNLVNKIINQQADEASEMEQDSEDEAQAIDALMQSASGGGGAASQGGGGLSAADLARMLSGVGASSSAAQGQRAAPAQPQASQQQGAISAAALASVLRNIGVPGSAGGDPGNNQQAAQQAAQALAQMARASGPSLAEVLKPEVIIPLLQQEGMLEQLAPHLPEEHRNQESLLAVATSAQWRHQLDLFSNALQTGQLDVRAFGLEFQGFSVADFLESIQKKADADGGEAQKKSKPS